MPLISADRSEDVEGPAQEFDQRVPRGRSDEVSSDEVPDAAPLSGPGGPFRPRYRRISPRRQPERISRTIRRGIFALGLVGLVGVGVALVLAGSRIALGARDGEVVEIEDDPTQPGYQAFVVPTPTVLVLHESASEDLVWAALVVTGADAGGGAVLRLPSRTLADDDERTLAAVHRVGPSATREAVERLFDIAIDSVVLLDRHGWIDLFAPVAPFPLELASDPDEPSAQPSHRMVTAAEAAELLEPTSARERDASHQDRIERVWRSWMAASAGGGDEVERPARSGIGRAIDDLRRGYVRHELVPLDPVEPLEAAWPGETHWRLRPAEMDALIVEVIPFPVGAAEGDRLRVRLLDGVGESDRALRAAQLLIPLGAELTIFGNADAFDVAATKVNYHRPVHREKAAVLAAELGVADPVLVEAPDGAVDLTITIGLDFVPS